MSGPRSGLGTYPSLVRRSGLSTCPSLLLRRGELGTCPSFARKPVMACLRGGPGTFPDRPRRLAARLYCVGLHGLRLVTLYFSAVDADVRYSKIHTATVVGDCSPLAVTWFPKATVNFVGLR